MDNSFPQFGIFYIFVRISRRVIEKYVAKRVLVMSVDYMYPLMHIWSCKNVSFVENLDGFS